MGFKIIALNLESQLNLKRNGKKSIQATLNK